MGRRIGLIVALALVSQAGASDFSEDVKTIERRIFSKKMCLCFDAGYEGAIGSLVMGDGPCAVTLKCPELRCMVRRYTYGNEFNSGYFCSSYGIH